MRTLFISTVASAALLMSSCAQAKQTTELSKSEIEQIVKDYLIANPEVIVEAMEALQQKEQLAEVEKTRNAIKSAKDALINDPRDVSIGPKDAKVTIVEFFDYNCGYCKRATPWVEDILEKHKGDVRIIFKELPILESRTKTSRPAAKAALAAARQGKYSAMHFALMKEKRLTADSIRNVAERVGLNMKKFDADMADPSIETHIDDTLNLATRLPALTGTPFFVINEDYVSGADTRRLEQLLDAALAG